MEPQKSPNFNWKGKSSEANLRYFGFNMLIFQGVVFFGTAFFEGAILSCPCGSLVVWGVWDTVDKSTQTHNNPQKSQAFWHVEIFKFHLVYLLV